MTVVVRPRAKADLAAILDHVSADDPAAAYRLLGRLRSRFEHLARHPAMGVAQDAVRPGLRLFPVGRYLVLYRRTGTGVEIVRVVHGARRWQDLVRSDPT